MIYVHHVSQRFTLIKLLRTDGTICSLEYLTLFMALMLGSFITYFNRFENRSSMFTTACFLLQEEKWYSAALKEEVDKISKEKVELEQTCSLLEKVS